MCRYKNADNQEKLLFEIFSRAYSFPYTDKTKRPPCTLFLIMHYFIAFFLNNVAQLLILGINPIEDINYEELNLSHHGNVCSNVLKTALKQILLNPNVQLLRRLSINICLFGDDDFEEVIRNCPLIEELEIWKCQ